MFKTIAYQGVQGAYSEQACKNAYGDYKTIACDTFHEAMWLVEQGESRSIIDDKQKRTNPVGGCDGLDGCRGRSAYIEGAGAAT